MEELKTAKAHKVLLANRKSANFSGVLDVLSFDVNEILLETEQGMLLIKGNDLHVNRLSLAPAAPYLYLLCSAGKMTELSGAFACWA